uniref:Uncharacterized protein n=1 Tax=Phaeomonas parva TaxID=124430 RepID=A0A7S1TUQ4_9STRA
MLRRGSMRRGRESPSPALDSPSVTPQPPPPLQGSAFIPIEMEARSPSKSRDHTPVRQRAHTTGDMDPFEKKTRALTLSLQAELHRSKTPDSSCASPLSRASMPILRPVPKSRARFKTKPIG